MKFADVNTGSPAGVTDLTGELDHGADRKQGGRHDQSIRARRELVEAGEPLLPPASRTRRVLRLAMSASSL
jgi:hypothetical protein